MIQHVVYEEYMDWKYAIMKDGGFLDLMGTTVHWSMMGTDIWLEL